MKFFHISDLHIGKQLHFYSLMDDQKAVLKEIVEKAAQYRPDAIIIAGDVFDKSVPSGESYTVFDTFLNELSSLDFRPQVLIVAGNHDSAERLNYAGAFLKKHKIHIGALPPERAEDFLQKVTLQDAFGEVDFYLLPFTKPAHVRRLMKEQDAVGGSYAMGEEETAEGNQTITYDKAVSWLIEREQIDYSRRNVLVAHQFFVAGEEKPKTCESEQLYLAAGGIDSVDVRAVKNFDYVALGHLHGSQCIGEEHIRYSGTPLKYSVSEERHQKGITFVTLKEKGKPPIIERIPLKADKDVRKVRGSLKEVLASSTEENRRDYVSITLTDEEELFYPKQQLEEKYDNILEVKIDNRRIRASWEESEVSETVLDPLEAFRAFYQEMQGVQINESEEKIMADVVDCVTAAGGE